MITVEWSRVDQGGGPIGGMIGEARRVLPYVANVTASAASAIAHTSATTTILRLSIIASPLLACSSGWPNHLCSAATDAIAAINRQYDEQVTAFGRVSRQK